MSTLPAGHGFRTAGAKLGLIHGLIGLITHLALALAGNGAPEPALPSPPPSPSVTSTEAHPGASLARRVCAGCHLFPEPDLLDRATWKDQILPRMETRLGVSPPDYSSSPEGELLRELELYPKSPLIPREDWDKIVDYYLTQAPATPLPQDSPQIEIGLRQFKFEVSTFRFEPPRTTLLEISPARKRILVGDEGGRRIAFLNSSGRQVESLLVDNIPVAVSDTPMGLYVTFLGSLLPSEVQRGALHFYPRQGEAFGPGRILLQGLPRAAHTVVTDFDSDGLADMAMCLFGNHRGRFSCFENLGDDQYREHVLSPKAGAIQSLVRDFNGDGSMDIALLMAQESESFQVLTNAGGFTFGSHFLLQRPPVFGHTHFELADLDGDGIDDLLLVNGDNGEFQSPPKRYHGLRIHRGRPDGTFETTEAFFFPLNGATKALARDFDEDGDEDIAAISYFPDYEKSPRESFVLLENHGNLKFTASTFSQCISGRWLTLDAGDLDGDGDVDLVLGSHIRGPTPVPEFLQRHWEKNSPSVVILRNRLR